MCAIAGEHVFRIGPIQRDRRVISRAGFDFLLIDIDVNQPIAPFDPSNRPRRDQNSFARPPISRVDDQVADAPADIVHEKVLDMAYLAVDRVDVVSGDCSGAAKVRVALVWVGFGAGRSRRWQYWRDQRRDYRGAAGNANLAAAEADKSGKLVIEAKHIGRSYGARKIVDDFSIRVQRGDRIGIVGPNGAGKTPLIDMLTGAQPPDSAGPGGSD